MASHDGRAVQLIGGAVSATPFSATISPVDVRSAIQDN